ncbi:hypothetical protein BH10PSE3_BH10PSE3_07240 [soil metagenome]
MRSPSHLSLFGRFAGPFPVPVETASAVARSGGQGRPSGRRGTRLVLDTREHDCTLGSTNKTGETSRAMRAAVAQLAALSLLAPTAVAMAQTTPEGGSRLDRVRSMEVAVTEAAQRSGLPEAWIWAVIRQESGGRVDALSSKGAMGLMQLMPATWRELAREYALGDDPYDVRANVIAGAAYLRQMHDRFGFPGFLAAYNAGPARYAKHLSGAQALPRETRGYVRALAPIIAERSILDTAITRRDPPASDLFVRPSSHEPEASIRGPIRTSAGGLWP